MFRNLLVLVSVLAAACGPKPLTEPRTEDPIPAKVVAEFERTTLAGVDEWITQFDFTAVGEFEILLHRYDLLGRLTLTEAQKTEYAAEDGTPYPPERERTNVGNFYKVMAQRTVGTGGCVAGRPKWNYNVLLGKPFEPLPPGNESHEPLRQKVNKYLENNQGGVIAIRCKGGAGSLALVYTRTATPRGYDIITIYNDGID